MSDSSSDQYWIKVEQLEKRLRLKIEHSQTMFVSYGCLVQFTRSIVTVMAFSDIRSSILTAHQGRRPRNNGECCENRTLSSRDGPFGWSFDC